MLISATQHSDSYTLYTYFFHILSHDGLSQDTEYSRACLFIRPTDSIGLAKKFVQVFL